MCLGGQGRRPEWLEGMTERGQGTEPRREGGDGGAHLWQDSGLRRLAPLRLRPVDPQGRAGQVDSPAPGADIRSAAAARGAPPGAGPPPSRTAAAAAAPGPAARPPAASPGSAPPPRSAAPTLPSPAAASHTWPPGKLEGMGECTVTNPPGCTQSLTSATPVLQHQGVGRRTRARSPSFCRASWFIRCFPGLPQKLSGKDSACKAGVAGDTGSIPGSGRSPEGGHGNPLQYSCLKNHMDRGAWRATVHGVSKSWT